MKNIFKFIILMLLVITISGCVTNTVEVTRKYEEKTEFNSNNREVRADLRGENYCVYLFGCLPILSGRTALPNAKQYYMWRDTVRNHDMKIMMNWYTKNVLDLSEISDYSSRIERSGAWTLWIVTKKRMIAHAKAIK